jgi:hypothetical protein
MRRSFLSVLALIVLVAESVVAQSTAPPRKLASIPQQLEAASEGLDPQWTTELDSIVQSATIDEIREVLPALVHLTESPNEKIRGNALFVLWAITTKKKASLPENRRELDLTAAEAIVPYIPRLKPRLTDSTNPSRPLSHQLFQAFVFIRPTPPELIKAALTVLKSPESTQPMVDTTHKLPVGLTGSSPGPQMLWILLPAAADFHPDPATNIIEGSDSPEVQEAIIQFLRRSDQTTESLCESMRALVLAQAQNPAVNAELLPLLSSPDVIVQKNALQSIGGLNLSPEDFATARARVTFLAKDPNTPMDVRQIASSLLPCWSNDRHHRVCPAL